MKKLNKKILNIILVLPVLVMLAHDIIPHHHHDTNTSANFTQAEHFRYEGVHSSDCQSHESTQHLSHSHRDEKSTCCTFVNLRYFKSFNFQIHLIPILLDSVRVLVENAPIRYCVSNTHLIPEPYRESTGLRGPPQV